jgi:uncharacterized membrane protein
VKILEKIASGIVGILLVLLILYSIIDGVMYIADWLRWLNIF